MKHKIIYLPLMSWIVLNTIDAILTVACLQTGLARELNTINPPTTLLSLIIKLIVLPSIMLLLSSIWINNYGKNTIILFFVLFALNLIFVYVCANNVIVLWRILKT